MVIIDKDKTKDLKFKDIALSICNEQNNLVIRYVCSQNEVKSGTSSKLEMSEDLSQKITVSNIGLGSNIITIYSKYARIERKEIELSEGQRQVIKKSEDLPCIDSIKLMKNESIKVEKTKILLGAYKYRIGEIYEQIKSSIEVSYFQSLLNLEYKISFNRLERNTKNQRNGGRPT